MKNFSTIRSLCIATTMCCADCTQAQTMNVTSAFSSLRLENRNRNVSSGRVSNITADFLATARVEQFASLSNDVGFPSSQVSIATLGGYTSTSFYFVTEQRVSLSSFGPLIGTDLLTFATAGITFILSEPTDYSVVYRMSFPPLPGGTTLFGDPFSTSGQAMEVRPDFRTRLADVVEQRFYAHLTASGENQMSFAAFNNDITNNFVLFDRTVRFEVVFTIPAPVSALPLAGLAAFASRRRRPKS